MTISDQAQTVTRPDPAASRAGGPTFTVVIAWSGAQRWLAACLYSLIPQCLRSGTELVIARTDPPSAMPQLSAAYPYVRFISAPPRTTLPDLRVAGFAAARGDVIAFLDDSDYRMVPDDCWVDRLRSLRALGPGSESDKQLGAGGRGHAGQGSQAASRQPPAAVGPCSRRPSARATRSASPASPCPGPGSPPATTAGAGLWTTPRPRSPGRLPSQSGAPATGVGADPRQLGASPTGVGADPRRLGASPTGVGVLQTSTVRP